jgi:hypothetical protein
MAKPTYFQCCGSNNFYTGPDPAFHFDTDAYRFKAVMYLKTVRTFYTSKLDFPRQYVHQEACVVEYGSR